MDDAMIAATAKRPNDEEGPDEAGSWVPAWVRIGKRNPWIQGAYDPPFGPGSLHECADLASLEERLEHGNWCLGQGFYLGDLCFVQQVNGGDEWLVIRRGVPFESITYRRMDDFPAWIERVRSATDEQLRRLEY